MAVHPVTINLPEQVYRQIKRAADARAVPSTKSSLRQWRLLHR